MLFILSPAKSLNYDSEFSGKNTSTPKFLDDSQILIDELRKLSENDLSKLMKISANLAKLNHQRYQEFQTPFNSDNSKPALFVFDGDVYKGIKTEEYSDNDLKFAQKSLRILSGLYGVLKPLDLIQPYRLEMGTSLKNQKGKDLYQFWKDKLTNCFNSELHNQKEKTIINLASNEYSAAIDFKKIKGRVVNIIFKEKKGDDYKIIGIMAKRARGLMSDYIIRNHIEDSQELKKFNVSGYRFIEELSDEGNWHFYS